MDPKKTIIQLCQEQLGFSGLRNSHDLSVIRQRTLEKKIKMFSDKLTADNVAAIYNMWLQEQPGRSQRAFDELVKDYCKLLESFHFQPSRIQTLWNECANEALKVATSSNESRLVKFHMDGVGIAIERYFGKKKRKGERRGVSSVSTCQPTAAPDLKVNQALAKPDTFQTVPHTTTRQREPVIIDLTEGSWETGPVRTFTLQQRTERDDWAARGEHFITSWPAKYPGYWIDNRTVSFPPPEDGGGVRRGPPPPLWASKEFGDPSRDNKSPNIGHIGEVRGSRSDTVAQLEAKSFLTEMTQRLEKTAQEGFEIRPESPRPAAVRTPRLPRMSHRIEDEEEWLEDRDDPSRLHPAAPSESRDDNLLGMSDDYSSPITPRSPAPIEFFVSPKPLYQHPPYHPGVISLFHNRANLWVQKSPRPSALDLWEVPSDGTADEAALQTTKIGMIGAFDDVTEGMGSEDGEVVDDTT